MQRRRTPPTRPTTRSTRPATSRWTPATPPPATRPAKPPQALGRTRAARLARAALFLCAAIGQSAAGSSSGRQGTMRKFVAVAALAAGIAALGACNRGGDSNALTAEDNAQLNEASNMLDASPDSLAVGNVTLGNGENAAGDSVEGDE